MNPASDSAARRPRHLGRHPAVIGALEAVRILLVILVIAFLLASAAWFIGIAEQKPLSAIPGWALTGTAAAAGMTVWPSTAGIGLPPSLLCLLVWLFVRTASRRTATALAANDSLIASGQLSEHRLPRTNAALTIGATVLIVIVGGGLLFGAVQLSVLGLSRTVLLISSAVVLGLGLYPRRAGTLLAGDSTAGGANTSGGANSSGGATAKTEATTRPGSTASAAWADRRADWAAALTDGHRLCIRTGWALAIVAALVLAVGLALSFSRVAAVVELYSAPAVAAVGLAVVQLLYFPGILAFVLAWLSGAGVHLSAAQIASAFSGTEGPRPAVPLLAVIPENPAGFFAVAPVLLVITGVLMLTLRRTWQHVGVPTVTVASAEVLVLSVGWALFSTGGLGPGGLSVFGVSPVLFPLCVGGLTIAGLWAGYGIILAARRAGTATQD